MKFKILAIIPFIAGCYTNSEKERVKTPPMPAEENAERPLPVISEFDSQLSAWTAFLGKVVNANGELSFAAIVENRTALDHFISYLSRTGPKKAPNDFLTMELKKSYYVNAYNANAMYLALKLGLHENKLSYLYKWRRIKFYSQETISVDGQIQTLTDFEDKVIRPLGDPRVHFVLNCLAVSCPRLIPEAVPYSNYESFMETRAVEFFNSPKHCVLNEKKERIEFSKILDWYKSDFETGSQTLIEYANRYRTQKIPDNYKVDYLDYDWNLNNRD